MIPARCWGTLLKCRQRLSTTTTTTTTTTTKKKKKKKKTPEIINATQESNETQDIDIDLSLSGVHDIFQEKGDTRNMEVFLPMNNIIHNQEHNAETDM